MVRQFIMEEGKLKEVDMDRQLPRVDILVLGAHNDDEVFPAGYLLQQKGDGKSVGVVIATDGGGSSYKEIQGQELIDLRTEESRKGVEALGGSFFIGYDYPSKHLKSDDGLASFADELTGVIDRTQPRVFLVQSPFEDHYTHLRTTEVGINAARKSRAKPAEILGYEVWTPLLGIQMIRAVPLEQEIADRKLELQAIYETQNSANPYHESTRALNLFNSVMADSHRAAGTGYSELYLDMSPLVHDERFADVSAAKYGSGLLALTQVMRTNPVFQMEKKKLSREEMLEELSWLIKNYTPDYKDGAFC